MLQAADLRGLYAIIPTPALRGADRIEATETVDLAETERLINCLLRDGAHGLIALGTTGECATLTNAEYDRFVDTVLSVVAKRVPTFIGTTALGSHEIVRRMAFVKEHGADGVLLGMPMWQPLTTAMAVEHYRAMSKAFPELAIMVYANQRAFRFNFRDTAFWEAVVKVAPTVMSAKFSVANAVTPLQQAAGGRVHFLPHDEAAAKFYSLAPETTTACWATAASMGPQPSLALINAILERDQPRIDAVAKDISWTLEPIAPLLAEPELFASYNIQVEKLRINAAGYCDAGPIRPPYSIVPDDIAKLAVECGQRWKTICEKYSATVSR
jgi:trans-o-hydroxybenzylidenepyruvate hydratase-aldolase